jgi:hypothetical protein
LAFLLYNITWLMKEIPHDDVASFCLAAPWHYVSGEGSLSILQTEYETPAVEEWVTSRQADVEDCAEADYTTSEGARFVLIYIGRIDLVI